jgi:hypothetical protein
MIMRKPVTIGLPHNTSETHHVSHVTPLPFGSGGLIGGAPLASPSSPMSLDQGARLQLEDKVQQLIDSWTEEEKATAYWYLFASGMNLEKAKTIRRRAGFVT